MRQIAHSPRYRAIVRGTRVKWWIFGVTLPLLPIAARVAAAWLDDTGTVSFVDLFGDGELLVLATVIAAAGIGDLVFDFRADLQHDGPEALRVASIHLLALIVVVGSVLLFGLVTYANQTRADALTQAQAGQLAAQRAADRSERLAAEQETRARQLDAQRRRLDARRRRATSLFHREVDGDAGSGLTGVAGIGPVADAQRNEILDLANESARLRAAADLLRASAARERLLAARRFVRSSTSLERGHEQAAVASIVMFALALAATFPAIGLSARRAAEAQAGS